MLSVVIPTLNAEADVADLLDALLAPAVPGVEVLLVDGGSTDATLDIAAARGVKVIASEAGRGRQLALGAHEALGPWLLFLHADSQLPGAWPEVISRFIANDDNVERAGYFALGFKDVSGSATRVALLANWRAKTWGLPYGDQGLLIHRTLYDAVGGYSAKLAWMEDVEMARRIGPMRLVRLPATIKTSAIKYQTGGWWAKPMKNLVCLALYLAGAPQGWIARMQR